MANETIITSITEIVPAEVIADMIMEKAIDRMVTAQFAREAAMPPFSGKTYNFPQLDKDTAEDITTEGTTTLSNVELTFSETSVTIAQVGLLREVSKLAMRTQKLGPALIDLMANDAASLLAEMVEDDLVGLFASITDSVGTSGADLTISNMLGVIAAQRINKAFGELVFILDDQQAADLLAAAASATSTQLGGLSVLNATATGRVGNFFGAEVYYSNQTDTANTGADVVGACIVNGKTNPERASLGLVTLWGADLDELVVPNKVTRQYAWTSAYGVGLIGDAFSCKIVTDA